MDSRKILLQNILNKSNDNTNVNNYSSLKDLLIECKINNFNGQYTGLLVEDFLKYKYNMEKNDKRKCIGDLTDGLCNYEVKVSSGGKSNNKFNYVQLRLNHNCDYILIAYHLNFSNLDKLGELFIFKISKSDIKKIIIKYGSYAHGTISKLGKITEQSINNNMNNNEYAIRPIYNDKCWNELLKFRIYEYAV